MSKRLFALCISIILICFSFCSCENLSLEKERTDEEMIYDRVNAFLTAYNSGDFEGVLESMDARTRNQFESMNNLLGMFNFSYGGISAGGLDFGDLFGFSVGAISEDDLMNLELKDLVFESETKATLSAVMNMTSIVTSVSEEIVFVLIKENGDWFIRDMRDK